MTTVKYILAALLYHSGLTFALKRIIHKLGGDRGLLVLLYHRVSHPGGSRPSLPEITVSPEMFHHQMLHVRTHYQPVSFSEYSRRSMARLSPQRIKVLVTFDDGWRDNYDHAFPILSRHGIPALIFLTARYIDTQRLFWPERLLHVLSVMNHGPTGEHPLHREVESALRSLSRSEGFRLDRTIPRDGPCSSPEIRGLVERLKQIPQGEVEAEISRLEALPGIGEDGSETKERALLDWLEIKHMSAGGIEFGSHTCNHLLLDQAPRDLVVSEIVNSRKMLEQRLDGITETFSYPNGNYDHTVLEETRRAGYKAAFTTKPGYNFENGSLFELKRIVVDGNFARTPAGKFSKSLFEFEIIRHIVGSGLRELVRPGFLRGRSDRYSTHSGRHRPPRASSPSIEQ